MRHLIALIGIAFVSCLSTPLKAQEIATQKSDEGALITIGNIYITGNNKTKLSIVQRELSFKEGDQLSQKELAQNILFDQQKLINTRLFLTVEIVPLMMSATEADILVRLEERWYIFPVPIFKLADRNFTEWWVNQNRDFSRVNYGLEVLHFNLTGRNDRFKALAQFGFTNRYQLSYQLPYINEKQTLGLISSISFSNNKTVSYTTNANRLRFVESDDIIRRTFAVSSTLSYRPNFYTTHGFSAGFNRVSASDTVVGLNPNYLLDGNDKLRYFRLGYVYVRDRRDYFAYPLTGKIYRFAISKIGLGVFSDVDMVTASASHGRYFDLGKGFYFGNRTKVFYNFSDDVPYLQRAGFGYRPDFIRGYERNVVEGNFFASSRSELKYKLISGENRLFKRSIIPQFQTMPYAIYVKLFADLGYVGEPLPGITNSFLNEKILGSIGVGVDAVTYYDFVVRFEFSVNREGQTGFFINFRSPL